MTSNCPVILARQRSFLSFMTTSPIESNVIMEVEEYVTFLSSFLEYFPSDQLVFASCLLFCYPLGIFYRSFLDPSIVSSTVRQAVGLTWGIIFGWISFRWQFFLIIGMAFSCYILTLNLNPKFVHRYTFLVSLLMLSVAHMYRQLSDYGEYKVDFTGPLMIAVQRVTYISLSVHDGQGRDETELSPEQKKEQLKKVPSVLEYFSYILHYSTLLVGPACTYREYKDFIDGATFKNKDAKKNYPSPLVPVIEKSLTSLLCLVLFVVASPRLSGFVNVDEEFIANHSFLWRLIHAWISMVTARMRYYFAFKAAEAVNNIIGLGFSGYDKNGQPLWNSMSNANILKVEFPLNMKMIFDNWNIRTGLWLRRCVYDRLTNHRTLAVFALSAVWHGFYGGYYLTFISGQLCLEAARAFRRSYRYKFQKTVFLSRAYDVITCFITVMCLSYLVVPFVVLDPWKGFRFWRSMYYYCHVLPIIVLLLSRGKSTRVNNQTTVTTLEETKQNGVTESSIGEQKHE